MNQQENDKLAENTINWITALIAGPINAVIRKNKGNFKFFWNIMVLPGISQIAAGSILESRELHVDSFVGADKGRVFAFFFCIYLNDDWHFQLS